MDLPAARDPSRHGPVNEESQSLDPRRSFDYPACMRLFLRALVLPLLSLSLLLASASARAEMKIAVVDVQRAVMQTEDGLRAQASIKKMFDSRQQELNKKQTDLAKQREDIDKQAKVISQQALQKRLEDWQKQMLELQQVFVDYNRELEKKKQELTDPIVEKIMGLIKRIAAAESYDLVVDRQAAAFVRGDLDLTDRCIQMYNGGGAGDAKAAAPAKK